jgi:hypothetical protein
MQPVPQELYDDRLLTEETIAAMFDEHLSHNGLAKNVPWKISWHEGIPQTYENGYPPLKWFRVQLVIHVLWRVRYLRRRVNDPRTYTTRRNWMARGITDVTPPEEGQDGQGS